MNSKISSVFGVVGMALAAVAFAATVYASPLLEQGHSRKLGVSRHTDVTAFSHEIDTAHAAHEKAARVQTARRPAYVDPFGPGSHCYVRNLTQESGAPVQICSR